MRLLPPGVLGLVFAALVAAIDASAASEINSIAIIFTLDLSATLRQLVALLILTTQRHEEELAGNGRSSPCTSP